MGMIEVRRAADRYAGGEPGDGVETRHAFSFAGFYEPENVRFGVLVACNEERLAPGAGFAEHTHRDTEIVTWVVEGELEHRGGDGATARLRAGDAQRLSAARGVRHVERNAGPGPLRFLQMWLHPDVFGGEPEYAAVAGAAPTGPGLRLLASGGVRAGAPLALRQKGAALYVGRPAHADEVDLPDAPFVYVHVVRGVLRVGGERLGPGDAARISEARGLRATAEGPAEYLVWEMHAEPVYG
jgi:redox-sensitive bicupin YhaK (pirin superfamily)